MSFVEINLFGVYVAPIAPGIVAAYVIFYLLRRLAARSGLLDWVWHPGLFDLALYLIVLSTLVLGFVSLRHV